MSLTSSHSLWCAHWIFKSSSNSYWVNPSKSTLCTLLIFKNPYCENLHQLSVQAASCQNLLCKDRTFKEKSVTLYFSKPSHTSFPLAYCHRGGRHVQTALIQRMTYTMPQPYHILRANSTFRTCQTLILKQV